MANTPALADSYVTLANAETVNTGDTDWDAASETEQEASLSYARQFIDAKYNCESFDEDDAPSEIQMANCLFAIEYLKDVLFDEADVNVIEESVKAGEVEAKTRFARSGGTSIIDPYPAITSILFGYCKLKSKGFGQISLVRG